MYAASKVAKVVNVLVDTVIALAVIGMLVAMGLFTIGLVYSVSGASVLTNVTTVVIAVAVLACAVAQLWIAWMPE